MNKQTTYLGALFLGLVLVAVSGCSTIHFKMPVNRFDSPETRGGFPKFHVDPVVLQGSTLVQLAPGFINSPPPVNDVRLEQSTLDYSLNAGIGLINCLDLELKYPNNAPTQLGLKFQFLGDNQQESKSGNFSVAVTAAAGYGSDTGSDSSYQIFGGNPVSSSFTTEFYNLDTSLIAGYRFHEMGLVYTGPFFTRYIVAGDVIQPSGGTRNYHFAGTGNQAGWNAGLEINPNSRLYFMADLAWARASYQSAVLTGWHLGGLVGVRF